VEADITTEIVHIIGNNVQYNLLYLNYINRCTILPILQIQPADKIKDHTLKKLKLLWEGGLVEEIYRDIDRAEWNNY